MRTNTGNGDRLLRIWVGAVLIGLAATDIIGPWGWIGVLPVLTGFIGWCPAYAVLDFSTCPAKN